MVIPLTAAPGGRVLSTAELRRSKRDRRDFATLPRRPITVLLDRVTNNYNIGAIFRLCDAFLIERLVIAGPKLNLRKRRLVQAAQGTQHWVAWMQADDALSFVSSAKSAGSWAVVAEQTTGSLAPQDLMPAFPACLILGSEKNGVLQEIVELADAAVAIPMLGMANSLNVASSAAILMHWLSLCHPLIGGTTRLV
jgi:tRNA G18 (ribose-2'-O)-methylase SpoU